jgi:hypothetical protein
MVALGVFNGRTALKIVCIKHCENCVLRHLWKLFVSDACENCLSDTCENCLRHMRKLFVSDACDNCVSLTLVKILCLRHLWKLCLRHLWKLSQTRVKIICLRRLWKFFLRHLWKSCLRHLWKLSVSDIVKIVCLRHLWNHGKICEPWTVKDTASCRSGPYKLRSRPPPTEINEPYG